MNTRFLIPALVLVVARGAYAEQTLFASGLTAPHSVTVGADGSVYLNANADDVFNPWATLKYSPAGNLLATWKLSMEKYSPGEYLQYDSASGMLWQMDSNGQFWLVNSLNGQRSAYLKLTDMAVDTSLMYDVNRSATTDFFGILNTRRVGYRSFALLRRGSQIDLFATGYFLEGEFPFLVRVRIPANGAPSAKILLISSSGGEVGPRVHGVAVNPQGTVLTAFVTEWTTGGPIYFGTALLDYGFSIPADFRPGIDVPTQALTGFGKPFTSGNGILQGANFTSDSQGNFYVATASASAIIYCGDYNVGLLKLPPDASSVTCLGGLGPLEVLTIATGVGVTASGDTAYMSVDQIIPDPETYEINTLRKGRILKFTQTACKYSLSPASASLGAGQGSNTFSVATAANCAFTPKPSDTWITVNTGKTTGSAAVSYTVQANNSTTARTGNISIGATNFQITQAAGTACTFSLSPASRSHAASAATGTVAVTAHAGCGWTAASHAAWTTVTSGASGNGNGTVSYSVAANPASTTRQTTITIGGQAFTVTQAATACAYSLNPVSRSHGSAAGSGTVGVTAGTGCGWTAKSNAAWTTVTAGASGTGNGTVSYSVAANTATTLRQSTITIGGQVFTVSQSGATCPVSLSPSSRSHAYSAGAGTVAVTAGAGCGWTATSNSAWVTVTSGASGNGNGAVGYSVAANTTTAQRQATLTIGGKAFTITQAAPACTYSLTPATVTVNQQPVMGSFTLQTGAGCSWTAISDLDWLFVTSSPNGTGAATIYYVVGPNFNGANRTGVIHAGGKTFTVAQTAQ